MKVLLSAAIHFLCISGSYAQSDTTKQQASVSKSVIADTTEDVIGCIFKIETEAEFPGAENAWKTFLKRNLVYPAHAIKNNIQGTVILQFIVCKDGTVCDIQAISGPEELKEPAINVLKKTPKWKPAIKDGRLIETCKRQPIVYRIPKK